MKAHNKGMSGFKNPIILKRSYGVCSDSISNHNKAYVVELHQEENTNLYTLYVSYGRIGEKMTEREYLHDSGAPLSHTEAQIQYEVLLKDKFGAPKCSSCGYLGTAGELTCKCARKFNFRDYTKKYVPVDLAQAKVGSNTAQSLIEVDKLNTNSQTLITSTTPTMRPPMHRDLQDFLRVIYEEAGHAARASINTGMLKATEDNPLGTLSQAQLEDGKNILDEIRRGILASADQSALLKLTTGFYTAVPQAIDRRPDWNQLCINDLQKLDKALDLVQLLGDVKGVQTSYKLGTSDWDRYDSIGADLEVLDPNDPLWKRLERSVIEGKSNYHSQFTRMKVRKIFKLRVGSQKGDWFDSSCGNVQALFHGSRNANILGITSKGLLLRPPGAIVTGSMFGNGLYFASNSTKSLQYSVMSWGASKNRNPNCYLYAASVALGAVKTYTDAQSYLQEAPYGYNSVKGEKSPYGLLHDEYIIYKLRQHRLDYIFDVDPYGSL